MPSAAERYLNDWHRRHPNATAAFRGMRDGAGHSSYSRLAGLASPTGVTLDIACGGGELLSLIDEAPHGALVGIDICIPELELTAKRVPSAHLAGARAQALPFADASVDVALCHMALMLLDEPAAVLKECARVLRPGGVFSSITNCPTQPDAVTKRALGALRDALRGGNPDRQPPTLGDIRTHDVESLSALVAEYFTDVRAEVFHVSQEVPRAELWSFLEQSVYGIDTISGADATRLLMAADLPEHITWSVPMVQVVGRACAARSRHP